MVSIHSILSEEKKFIGSVIAGGLGRILFLSILGISLVPLVFIGWVNFNSAKGNLEKSAIDSLSTAVKLKAEYINSSFHHSLDELRIQASSSRQVGFLGELRLAFDDSPHTLGEFIGSADWQEIVDEFGEDLRQVFGIYGYSDIYLIDSDGRIIFSVQQRADLGMNILYGQFADSQFGRACAKAARTGMPAWSDLELYQPADNALVSFMVQKMVDADGVHIGFMAFQLSVAWLDAIMQESIGLGSTGETYLVGSDLLMRSNSRLSPAPTVLTQKVDTQVTREWLRHLPEGHSGEKTSDIDSTALMVVQRYKNYRQSTVLGVHHHLDVLDDLEVPWVVIGEITAEEAFAAAGDLKNFSVIILAATAIIVLLMAFLLTAHITRPMRRLSTWAKNVADGDLSYEKTRDRDDEIGEMEKSFTKVVRSFRELADICAAVARGNLQMCVMVRNDKDLLGASVNQMIENLREAVQQADSIAKGDYSVTITPKSDVDELGMTLLHMTQALRQVTAENTQALQKARQLIENLDNLPSPVFTIDREFTVTYINPAGAAVVGLPPEDCIGAKCQGMFMTPLCHSPDCPAVKAMRSGEIFRGETCIDPDYLNMPVEFSTAPVRDSDGAIVGALEFFTDISRREEILVQIRQQEWLREGRVQLNELMRGEQEISELANKIITFLANYLHAQLGALYIKEDDRLFLSAFYGGDSRAFRPTFHIGEGLVGQAAAERQRKVLTELPDDFPRAQTGLGEARINQVIIFPFQYYTLIKGVVELGTIHEFTDSQKNFVEQVGESIGIAIASCQSRDQLADLLQETQRQAQELQVQQEELRQANEELAEQTMALRSSEEELQAQQEELRATNEELEERTKALEEQKENIRLKNRELQKAQEILEQKTEDLELAGKYKSEFLANMSHELRTPLNSLLILSKLLMDNTQGNLTERQIEFAHTIHSAGNDLLKLINEILDLSKVEAGKIALHPEMMDFKELADSMQRQFSALADEKKLEFLIELDADLPAAIRTDTQRVEQILKNFLSNAFKFTGKGHVKLHIGCGFGNAPVDELPFTASEVVYLTVSDTGLGVPANEQKRIFEAFQQVDGSTSRKFGGTGLGLSISKKFAELLGGGIWLRSEQDKGSHFTLVLPSMSFPEEQPEVAEPSAEEVSESDELFQDYADAPITVEGEEFHVIDDRRVISDGDRVLLVVEDDPQFARILKTLAEQWNFKCVIAETGESALHYADFYQPLGIILDLGLPGMDGLTVMKRLKKNPKTRHIPVHVISGAEKKLDVMRLGAVGFLHKPVTVKELKTAFEKIDTVLEKVKKVLVVWSDPEQARDISSLISGEDVEVTTANSGMDVIRRLQSGIFDCMVMDIDLDGGKGIDLLHRISDDDTFNKIPVVIYANKDLSATEEKKLKAYADSIVIKEVKTMENLLDEATLFLHQVDEDTPSEKRKPGRMFGDRENIFRDKKILIVDDDMRNVFALTSILEEKGIEVIVGRNGKECLDRLEAQQDIDLVLMDIMMPEMDGYEAMQNIRKQGRLENLPVIALTAKAMKGDKRKCIEAGASDYMAKPVQTEKLMSLLRVWLYQ